MATNGRINVAKRPDTTQQEQARLLEEARKQSGVAEALDAYNAASEYVLQATVMETETVRYGTGAN